MGTISTIGIRLGPYGWARKDFEMALTKVRPDVLVIPDHMTAMGTAHGCDPFVLAAALSQMSDVKTICLHTLNCSTRHPVPTACAIMALQRSIEARLEVGLGAGSARWSQPDHMALGIPFRSYAARIARLDRFYSVLIDLLAGKAVSSPELDIGFARLAGGSAPTFSFGGRSDRIRSLADTYGCGWHIGQVAVGGPSNDAITKWSGFIEAHYYLRNERIDEAQVAALLLKLVSRLSRLTLVVEEPCGVDVLQRIVCQIAPHLE